MQRGVLWQINGATLLLIDPLRNQENRVVVCATVGHEGGGAHSESETHGVGWGDRNFHGGNGRGPPKRAGEQTDYGDYNILTHLEEEKRSLIKISKDKPYSLSRRADAG